MIKNLLAKYDKDKLLVDSFIVLLLTNVGSVVNLLFHVAMGRTLSEGEYGQLSSMLGVYLVFSMPVFAIQNTLAHFSGHLEQLGRRGDIRRLTRHWLLRIAIIVLPMAIIACLLAPVWQNLLHLDGTSMVYTVIGMIVVMFFLPIFVGALQGLQSFVWMCTVANAWAFIRLAMGILLVLLIAPLAIYGLVSHLTGILFSLILGAWVFYRLIPHDHVTGEPLEKSDKYLMMSIISLFAFAVLMTGDIVLVKGFFPSETAYGPYSRASTIARTLIFLCQPIAGVLFPKVISKGAKSEEHVKTLWKAIGLTGLMIGAAVVLCLSFPQIPLRLLYNVTEPSTSLIALVRWVTIAMAPIGLSFVLLNFEMAQHRFSFMIPMVFCAGMFMVGSLLFHQTLGQFIAVYCVASYSSLAVMIYAVIQTKKK